MLKPLPDDHECVPRNIEEDWLETLRKHEGDQVEWLKNNVRDPEYYHNIVKTDLYSDMPGLTEYILDQRECAVGTALYVYLLAMHYDPRDVFDQEWNMTTFRHQRHLDLKLRAAQGLREERYVPVAYAGLSSSDGPRGDNFNISNEELFDMIRRLPENHPMALPASALEVPWEHKERPRYPWFYNDEVGAFTETYDTCWRRKYGDPEPEPKPRRRTASQGHRRTNEVAPILGAMAIGLAASFLRGRR